MTTDLTYTNSGFIFFPRRSPEAVISGLYDILTSYQACRFPLAFCITVVSTQFNPKISKMAAGVIAITSTFQAGKGRSERKKRACTQGLSALLSPLRVFLKVRLIPIYNLFSSVQFSSVTQSCLTLCNPMNRSTPGLPVHHQLLEFTQTHIH